MKKLNKHTYEAWLLDYHEGNLSAGEKQELIAFMTANPHLQWGEHELSETTLKPETEVFQLKNKLHKNEFGLEANKSELEYKMIELVEGLLTKTEAENFENKLSAKQTKTLKHYKASKLTASDESYLHKKTLYKQGKNSWFLDTKSLFIRKEYFSYAASLLAVILAVVWLQKPNPNASYEKRIAFMQVDDFKLDLNETLIKSTPEKKLYSAVENTFEEKQNSPTLKKETSLALHLQPKEKTSIALFTHQNNQLDIVNRINSSDFFVEENSSESETILSPEITFKTKARIKNVFAALTKPVKTKIDEQIRFEELQNEKGHIVAWELALGPVQIKRNLK